MSRKTWPLVVLAVVLAAVFARLGLWQISRLHERRARNAEIAARFAKPAVPFDSLHDTLSYNRAIISGLPDYEHEVVYAGRSHDGSPGVYILTPIIFAKETVTVFTPAGPMRRMSVGPAGRPPRPVAALVIRGWVYAPDAATIDLSRWRENRGSYSGYVAALTPPNSQPVPTERKVRSLSRLVLQGLFPYMLSPMYLVAQDSAGANTPVRLPPPLLDDGPHLSYAIQWFSFAAIALAGAVVVARRAQSVADVRT